MSIPIRIRQTTGFGKLMQDNPSRIRQNDADPTILCRYDWIRQNDAEPTGSDTIMLIRQNDSDLTGSGKILSIYPFRSGKMMPIRQNDVDTRPTGSGKMLLIQADLRHQQTEHLRQQQPRTKFLTQGRQLYLRLRSCRGKFKFRYKSRYCCMEII
jgi:hypothetical protein